MFGMRKDKRLLKLASLTESATTGEKKTLKIDDNVLKSYPIINIPVELPKYRLKNVRTKFDRIAYDLEHDDLSENIFNDEESNDAQKIQHSILQTLYHDEGLFETFESGERPIDPIILTQDGFVIAGNRRLATFRDLVNRDSNKYNHLKTIQVILVPFENNSEAVRKIEAIQETDRDRKSEFDWIAVGTEFIEELDSARKNDSVSLERCYEILINRYKNSDYFERKKDKKVQKRWINTWVYASKQAIELLKSGKLSKEEIINQKQAFKNWGTSAMKIENSNHKTLFDFLTKNIICLDKHVVGDRKHIPVIRTNTHIEKIYNTFKTKYNDPKSLLSDTDFVLTMKMIENLKKLTSEEIFKEGDNIAKMSSALKNDNDRKNILNKKLSDSINAIESIWPEHVDEDTNFKGVETKIKRLETIFIQIRKRIKRRK